MNTKHLIVTLVLTIPSLLQATFTPISVGGGGGERKLTGQGGILDKLYGWENVTRIEDSDSVITDQYWVIQPDATRISDLMVSKNAGFTLDFGFLNENGGNLVFDSDLARIDPGASVQLALNILSKPGYVWSSAIADNKLMPNGHVFADRSVIDHMVTFLITSSDKQHNNAVGNYVVAWEDLEPGNLLGKFDGDYNDLVVEINGLQPVFTAIDAAIPEPSAIALLLLSGVVLLKKQSRARTPQKS